MLVMLIFAQEAGLAQDVARVEHKRGHLVLMAFNPRGPLGVRVLKSLLGVDTLPSRKGPHGRVSFGGVSELAYNLKGRELRVTGTTVTRPA